MCIISLPAAVEVSNACVTLASTAPCGRATPASDFGQAASEPFQLVAHDTTYSLRLNVGEEFPKRQALSVRAGEAAIVVVIWRARPTHVLLAGVRAPFAEGPTGLAIGVCCRSNDLRKELARVPVRRACHTGETRHNINSVT